MQDAAVLGAVASLKDSLLAIKLLPEEHRRSIEGLTGHLRDLQVDREDRRGQGLPGAGASLHRYRRRSVQLPTQTDLGSSLSTKEQQEELEKQHREAEELRRKQGEEKVELYQRLNAAVDELTRLAATTCKAHRRSPAAAS